MKKEVIAFKGVSDGVYLEINGSDMEDIKDKIDKKIKRSPAFFQGTNFLYIEAKELSPNQILDIELTLKYKYDFKISIEEQDFSWISPSKTEINVENADIRSDENVDSKEEMTKFIYRTLRSGQVVEYNGNIVVIGDVNPGALLKANGNIIVLGTLKGVAHAGLNGNKNSIVAAYQLMPTQLRIGNVIVRAPDDNNISLKVPEVAKIYDGEVIIEPYLPNK